MKPTPTAATPAMKIVNGKQCVRVLDLAKAWGTSTATILATDKPHAVPDRFIHRINGRAWCELEGLRQRADAVKDRKSSYISREIIDFLDSLEKPIEPKPEPQATDLGTAALIADARRTANIAIVKTNENRGILDGTIDAVNGNKVSITDNAASIHVAKDIANKALDTATQAADLAQENADIVSGEIERLTKLSERVDRVEKDAIAHRCDALQRVRQAECKQRDNEARIATLEEHARALDWTLAAVAMLGVVVHVIRLLHRR